MNISITDAELAVMKVLWEASPLNARQITERLSAEKDWHRKTVNTLLSRLETKGAIAASRDETSVRHFTPRIEQEDYGHTAASELVDTLFDGELAPMVACFARKRPLSEKQIAELRRLVEELEDDGD